MDWIVFTQIIIGLIFLSVVGNLLLRYLDGDFKEVSRKEIEKFNILRKRSFNETVIVGIKYVYQVEYQSGRIEIQTKTITV